MKRRDFIRELERATAKNPPDEGFSLDEAVTTQEQELKLRTIALRGLIGVGRTFADEDVPKKGK